MKSSHIFFLLILHFIHFVSFYQFILWRSGGGGGGVFFRSMFYVSPHISCGCLIVAGAIKSLILILDIPML